MKGELRTRTDGSEKSEVSLLGKIGRLENSCAGERSLMPIELNHGRKSRTCSVLSGKSHKQCLLSAFAQSPVSHNPSQQSATMCAYQKSFEPKIAAR